MAHRFSFFRSGGFDQVRLDTGADFAALNELDPKLWVALSCPTVGIEVDPHTLELLDIDKDGRIRVPEVTSASAWAAKALKRPDLLVEGAGKLPLDAINDSTDEGKQLLAAAKHILKTLGRPTDTAIAPGDTANTMKILSASMLNGDGVLPPEAASDPVTAAALKDIMATFGTVKDLSGLDGTDAPKVKQFFDEAKASLEWWKKSQNDPQVLPLKDGTVGAWEALEAVRGKVDDYFARCAISDMMGTAALNPPDAEWVALAREQLSGNHERLATLPLARVGGGAALPLQNRVNPAWVERIAHFDERCVVPLLGKKSELSYAEWKTVNEKLSQHGTWLSTRPKSPVEKLGLARLKELVEGPAQAAIAEMFAQEKALEPEMKGIASVDRLTHYVRDLKLLLENYVSFRDFYSPDRSAIFQAGTLYLDTRSMELCVRVDDIAKHAALALHSAAFLAYCECSRKGTGEKMNIVAAFTGGDADFLTVGRNGVFFDRKGNDWDATIVKVIEAPISVRQAFFSPYKRLARFITEQIEKFASSKDKEAGDTLVAGATAAKPPPFDVAKFTGILAAVGLAVGSIGTALAAAAVGLFGLKFWQIPLVMAGIALLVSGPAMLFAAMKLRLRTVAPLLEASGWAINARVHISIPFGATLTQLAVLPPGSTRSLTDPYAEKKTPWGTIVFVLAVIAALGWSWYSGQLAAWFPDVGLFARPGQTKVVEPPAAAPTAPAAPAAPAAPEPKP